MKLQLAGEDAAWLHMDRPENQMVIAGLLELGGAPSREGLRRVVEDRLLEIARFRQRVVEPALPHGPPWWEDDPRFDVDRHLRWESIRTGEEALREAVGRHVSEPLPRDRPLWIMHGLERESGGTVLLCRIHHAIADGFALLAVLLSLTDDASGERSGHLRPDVEPAHGIARLARASRTIGSAIRSEAESAARRPLHLLELTGRGVRYGSALARLISLPPDPPTALRGPLISDKRVAWARPIALDRAKAVGGAEHATVNDVLVSAISGGLRRYLEQRGEDVDRLEIRAMVPVNARPPGRPITLGNRFGMMVLDLAIRPRHAEERLLETKRRMDALKLSGEAEVGMAILGAMGFVPRRLESIGVRFFTHKSSVVLTNVIGPRSTLSLGGCPIERILFWVPQSGEIGLGLSILSYRGEISIGVMADALRVPDPAELVEGIERELRALGI
jgi:WS/DGAT/MGAT family acyltransferase